MIVPVDSKHKDSSCEHETEGVLVVVVFVVDVVVVLFAIYTMLLLADLVQVLVSSPHKDCEVDSRYHYYFVSTWVVEPAVERVAQVPLQQVPHDHRQIAVLGRSVSRVLLGVGRRYLEPSAAAVAVDLDGRFLRATCRIVQ